MVGQNCMIPCPLECHSLSLRCLAIPRTPVPSRPSDFGVLLRAFCPQNQPRKFLCLVWGSHQGLPPILKFLLFPSPCILNFNSLFDHQVTAWQGPGKPRLPWWELFLQS